MRIKNIPFQKKGPLSNTKTLTEKNPCNPAPSLTRQLHVDSSFFYPQTKEFTKFPSNVGMLT